MLLLSASLGVVPKASNAGFFLPLSKNAPVWKVVRPHPALRCTCPEGWSPTKTRSARHRGGPESPAYWRSRPCAAPRRHSSRPGSKERRTWLSRCSCSPANAERPGPRLEDRAACSNYGKEPYGVGTSTSFDWSPWHLIFSATLTFLNTLARYVPGSSAASVASAE